MFRKQDHAPIRQLLWRSCRPFDILIIDCVICFTCFTSLFVSFPPPSSSAVPPLSRCLFRLPRLIVSFTSLPHCLLRLPRLFACLATLPASPPSPSASPVLHLQHMPRFTYACFAYVLLRLLCLCIASPTTRCIYACFAYALLRLHLASPAPASPMLCFAYASLMLRLLSLWPASRTLALLVLCFSYASHMFCLLCLTSPVLCLACASHASPTLWIDLFWW